MAIYGTLDVCARQVGDRPHFAEAIQFVQGVLDGSHEAAGTLRALASGQIERVNLAGPDGQDAYALLQYPTTRERSQQKAESHRAYADVQAVIDGDELLEVMPLGDLDVSQEYDAGNDVTLYKMPTEATKLIMRPGLAAILFPEDGHAPLQATASGPAPSRRVVVKVRVK